MSDSFAQRLEAMIAALRTTHRIKVTTAKIRGGCTEAEITKVHRAIGYRLSDAFLSYYRSANGACVRWKNDDTSGGFDLLPLSKIFLNPDTVGGPFMPDCADPGERKVPLLGGVDEHLMRRQLRWIDKYHKDQGYPTVALFSDAEHTEPVVIFPNDCCAALADDHPILATSYFEMLLITGGYSSGRREFFGKGYEGPFELIDWNREQWSSMGDVARYLRWLRGRNSKSQVARPGQPLLNDLLAAGMTPAAIGPARWIELRWGSSYPALPDVVKDIGPEPEMVSIPGGTFVQGSPVGELGSWEDERPQHEVTLAAFNMSKYPITEKRYRDVMDLSLLGPETADFPVQPVTWFDALRFCNKLSERAGMQPAYTIEGSRVDWNRNANGYRLPTESEWEYATRAGSTTMYYFGDDPARLPEYGWFADDGDLDVDGNQRKPVGRRPANPWGLHDLCGNVAEWCWDLYVPYDQHHQYGVSKTDRVVRGRIDSYIGRARALRSAARFHADSKKAEVHFGIGFRCVLPVHVPENVQR